VSDEKRIVGEFTFADGSVEPVFSGDFPRGPSADVVIVDDSALGRVPEEVK
jgi:hypothetical protein